MPAAILARVEAVAGATSITSAHIPSSTWLFHTPSVMLENSLNTGRPLKADKVTGVMKSLAQGVITTCTSAPAFFNNRTSCADL